LVLIPLVALYFSSCATLISGTSQNIKVKSHPEGAQVFINGQNTYYQTPCKVQVNRRQKPTQDNKRNELNIQVRKEGYENADLRVHSSFNVVTAGNVVVGFVPFIVDWVSGAHLKYPRANYLYLKPVEKTTTMPMIAMEMTTPKKTIEYYFKSDIDYDIPKRDVKKPNRFALIIGNEEYSQYQEGLDADANVKYAHNDALSFKEYALNVLGIPDENITFLTDATLAKMQQGIGKMNLLAKNSNGEAELYFFYAGHGLPHEKTKDPYLIPVDVSGKDLDFAVGLDDALKKLSEYETKNITCFLDCCFSGGSRVGGIYESRGVKIVPKQPSVSGNMVVFAASSSEQSALAYNDQKHGLFTYLVLKKFKESNGEVTYGDMEEYLKKNLPIQSVLINEKEQSPQINTGSTIDKNWKNWKF
jgi:hypothetical protein